MPVLRLLSPSSAGTELLPERPRQSRRLAMPGLAAWRWPLPAVLTWLGAWATWSGLHRLGSGGTGTAEAQAAAVSPLPLLAALGVSVLLALAWPALALRRRLWLAAGFPASALALGLVGGLPPLAWLVPLAVLLLLYPLGAWRDAPLYPTPAGALRRLPRLVRLAPESRVLDAGCGAGHGLQALGQALPVAHLEGIERSWPLVLAARWRCPLAQVHRGDMWRLSWSGYALVYLFQRPESMARAWDKACAEMAPGSWLVSLDFAVPGAVPRASWRTAGGRWLWLYRVEGPAGDAAAPASDKAWAEPAAWPRAGGGAGAAR